MLLFSWHQDLLCSGKRLPKLAGGHGELACGVTAQCKEGTSAGNVNFCGTDSSCRLKQFELGPQYIVLFLCRYLPNIKTFNGL